MDSRRRLVTFALPLILICFFLCLRSIATDERSAGQTFAELAPANNSLGPQETALPGQAESQQSTAKDPDPLFPIVEHGKWGYMDRTGTMVISPEYYDAAPCKEGLARRSPRQL